MSLSPFGTNPFDQTSLSIDTKWYGTWFIGLSVVFLVLPDMNLFFRIVKVVSLLGALYTGWLVVWHGTTWMSVLLSGDFRKWFQVIVSVLVPAVLSILFFHQAETLKINLVSASFNSNWTWIQVAFMVLACWWLSENLNKDHPFRGFLVISIVLFVMLYFKHMGGFTAHDEYDDSSSMYFDKEKSAVFAQTGRYGMWFVLDICLCYLTMLIRIRLGKNTTW
jgi:hypothetical protein